MHIAPLVINLVINAVLAFIASILAQKVILRFTLWWLIPLLVTVLTIGPENFSLHGGEQSMVWLFFVFLFALGLAASGVGILSVFFLRRTFKKNK
jgi:hypothetical protein